MNCKKGDMALIISGVDSGKMLTCIELAGDRPAEHDDLPDDPQNKFSKRLGPVWRTDRPISWFANHQPRGLMPYCPDEILRPITPDDQTLLEFKLEANMDRLNELTQPPRERKHNRVSWP